MKSQIELYNILQEWIDIAKKGLFDKFDKLRIGLEQWKYKYLEIFPKEQKIQ